MERHDCLSGGFKTELAYVQAGWADNWLELTPLEDGDITASLRLILESIVPEIPTTTAQTITASSRAICIRTTKHAEAEETLPNHSNSAFIRTVMQRRKEGMQSNAHLIPHESPNS
ncbi:hypothetical protein PGT21_023797 [Puccinia graminis f. sp. tritici]|uniref:Uncharacterized protein n=1 Tax=Puccinia graminis f. sp. tritici TaxID=56615 RepID=A0A5B0P514_PUCGR|nr:hypothetical protein PGT21_023797 [Puccinia graminis f. sp. tritici]